MERRFRKEDVQFHSYLPYGGPPTLPAVNVKAWPDIRPGLLRQVAEDMGEDPGRVCAWWDMLEDSGAIDDCPNPVDTAWEWAREEGWEQAEELAEESFPDHPVKIESAGRSGGWLVVHGLPDVEDWDAILVSRWGRFERLCRLIAEDVAGHSLVSLLILNPYAAWVWEQDKMMTGPTHEAVM